jgi:hypothetical protein
MHFTPETLLVDDRVDRDRGLAGLAVADDQLALAAADRDHRVDRLDAGLQRLVHRLAVRDARRDDVDLRVAVERATERVDHAAEHRLADPLQIRLDRDRQRLEPVGLQPQRPGRDASDGQPAFREQVRAPDRVDQLQRPRPGLRGQLVADLQDDPLAGARTQAVDQTRRPRQLDLDRPGPRGAVGQPERRCRPARRDLHRDRERLGPQRPRLGEQPDQHRDQRHDQKRAHPFAHHAADPFVADAPSSAPPSPVSGSPASGVGSASASAGAPSRRRSSSASSSSRTPGSAARAR